MFTHGSRRGGNGKDYYDDRSGHHRKPPQVEKIVTGGPSTMLSETGHRLFQSIKDAIIEPNKEHELHGVCPLMRIKVFHAIPLCLLAIIVLLLASIILIVLALYRLGLGVGSIIISSKTIAGRYSMRMPSHADTEGETSVPGSGSYVPWQGSRT